MSKPRAILENWIESIQSQGRNLTKWEEDFVESTHLQLLRYGGNSPGALSLNKRQEDILERIYAEKTP